jgi:signal transduction histidine kinase
MKHEYKVLVVDDEPGMQLGVQRILENHVSRYAEFEYELTFSVNTVSCGKDALKLIQDDEIDILILDHKLPDIKGLDILTKVKQMAPDIQTIMVTAFASLDIAIAATRNGAFDFLAKPFTPSDIRSRIDKVAKHIFLHRKTRKLEEEKRQVRFQFISVLAHELKAPLNAVDGYLQLMEQRVGGDDITKYETMISRSKQRIGGMRKMIMDLLDLTRIESGNKKRNIDDVDILELIEMAKDNVMLDAKEKNISFEFDIPENLRMVADSDEIMIIMNNLLTNAVKYNKNNGSIFFKAEELEGAIKLTCRDTGIGMSKEEMEKLFGEFSRIKNNKTKDIMGSGLGLLILKRTIDTYKGSIKVDSEPDQGTTFTVILKPATRE